MTNTLQRTEVGGLVSLRAPHTGVTVVAPSQDAISAALAEDSPGGRLRALRKAHGLTVLGLATVLDTSREMVERVERGQHRQSKWMPAMAQALGVTLSDVLTGGALVPVRGDADLGKRLTEWRETNGLTRRQAAYLAGLDDDVDLDGYTAVLRVEQGLRTVPGEAVASLERLVSGGMALA